MAITVTATPTGGSGNLLRVLVLTGATEAGGASAHAAPTGSTISVTPNFSNSFIVWSIDDRNSSTSMTAFTNNTLLDNVALSGARLGSGYYSGTVTASTAVTAGLVNVDGSSGYLTAAYEVPASGGSTPSIDASSPAAVSHTSGTTACTTASFTPPGGAVVVAIVNGSSFPSAWTVTDSSSMTWTKRVDSTDGQQVWTATVPAGGSSVTGVVATATLAAPAGSVTAGAAVSGTVAAATLAAPAGSVSAGAVVSGAVAPLTLAAPAGIPTVATTVAGVPATLTLAAPAGTVKAGATVAGAVAPLALAAPSGSVSGGGVPTLVQSIPGTSTGDYGMSSVQISTTGGNGVVVFAGWDVHNGVTDAPIPVAYVADSAANIWYHLGTSGAGGYGSRSAIWWCPNARAMEWVSVCTTAFTSSLAYLVCEFSGLPAWSAIDLEADAFSVAGGASQQVFTKAGPIKWTCPDGVSAVNTGCTADGGGGQGGLKGGGGGAGGGAGEYAGEPALAVTPRHVYSGSIGPGGDGGAAGGFHGNPGSGTVFHGDSVTVTAHPGQGGNHGTGGAPGSGSTNTVHHSGGTGGSQSSSLHGEGGGSSAGPASAGGSVGTDVKAGAPGVAGGGPGGNGGNSTSPLAGNTPAAGPGGGGGGGGASSSGQGPGANGFQGQIALSWSVTSPVTLGLSATTGAADIGFALFAAGSGTASLTASPGAPWSALTTVAANPASDGMTIFPYWASSVSSGTNLTPSWTVTPSASLSAVMAGIQASPAAPTQVSASSPSLVVEMAFGFTPGDPTAAPPTWTDITSQCIGKTGDPYVSPYYGREYELSSPEAGTMVIGVDNHTGNFTPTNQASPYWPNVLVSTAVRVRALWDGAYYPVAYGYVERWPQEWPDLPQFGLSKLTITDSIAVLASANIPSALIGQVLAGGPYALFPCTEQYLTYINGLTPVSGNLASYSISEAEGLIAANASRTNQVPGTYCDGTLAQMETGAALNLQGDQGTGCGTSAISGNVTYGSAATTGPGMIYTDPNMPDPQTSTGMSIELWFVYNFSPEVSGQGCTIFQAFSGASSYWPVTFNSPGSAAGFVVYLNSTSNTIGLIINGTSTSAGSFTPSSSPQHLVITWPGSAGSTLNVYLNGALLHSTTLTGGEITSWNAIALGPCTYAYAAAPFVQNYVGGRLGLYSYTMPAAQVAANYSVGANGAAGANISQRAAQILDWAYLGLPRGGPTNFGSPAVDDGIYYSAAYSIDGSSASDALNAVIPGNGMVVSMPTGTLTVLPKWALLNLTSSWTLGDATDGSEIPYLPGQAYDYDNTYLFDNVAVTRQNGPNTSITADARNIGAQAQYFPRGALTQSIETTSDLDAYTLANFELATYEQPSLRVRNVTIDAASNPAQAFPAVLLIKAGDVVTVNRRPAGGAAISGLFIVQKVSAKIGAAMWRVDYQMSPYVLPAAVLTLDESGYNILGQNTLG